MFSQVAATPGQAYSDNPDASAEGYFDLLLCPNGTMQGTLMVFGSSSPIISTQIQRCQGGSSNNEVCQGTALVNFCGSNSDGLIADGSSYPTTCEASNRMGASRTAHMPGVLVPNGNTVTAADAVNRLQNEPDQFFFIVHTMASWAHWYPSARGACRGPLKMYRS